MAVFSLLHLGYTPFCLQLTILFAQKEKYSLLINTQTVWWACILVCSWHFHFFQLCWLECQVFYDLMNKRLTVSFIDFMGGQKCVWFVFFYVWNCQVNVFLFDEPKCFNDMLFSSSSAIEREKRKEGGVWKQGRIKWKEWRQTK